MANLTTVKETVEGWKNAVLVKDESTGRHFVVTTAAPDWAPEKYETLAYESDAQGSPESVIDHHHESDDFAAPLWVAGGRGMDRDEAMADLSARLDDNVLLTTDEVIAANRARFEEDQQDFVDWLFTAGAAQLQDVANS